MRFEPVPQGQHVALSAIAHPSRPPLSLPQKHRDAMESGAPQGWSFWDYAGMLTGFLLTLLVTWVNSRGRLFWEDEMLGWMLLRDPSWHHMIRAWNLGADGGGFSFYLLGRAWFHIFGASALTFRLFSSTCFGLAFAALWATLRRFYPLWIVAFASFNTLFFSPPLTMHYIEGRFYGLLVLGTALALWLAVQLDHQPEPTPLRFYVLTFLIHALLTTSHLLGVVYSFFLLAAVVLVDHLRGRHRWKLYLSGAAAWLFLLPERTAIHAAGEVGKPHFWTKPPTFGQVVGSVSGFSMEILLVLVLLLLGATLSLPRSLPSLKTYLGDIFRKRQALYVAAGCLLLVPLGFLMEGLVGTWLFADRYLQPVALGTACLTAELLMRTAVGLRLDALRRRWPRLSVLGFAATAAGFALALVFWVFHHVAEYTPSVVDFTGPLTEHLPHDLPVVVEDAFTFTELMSTEAASGVPYTFLLDWPYALSPQAPWLEVTQFHLMQNWQRAGYFPGHIDSLDRFLKTHPAFLVINNTIVGDPNSRPEIGNPIAQRLAATPGYEVRKYFTLDRSFKDNQRDTVYLVCRGSCNGAHLSQSLNRQQSAEICELTGPGKAICCQGNGCKLPPPPKPPRFWQITHWFK